MRACRWLCRAAAVAFLTGMMLATSGHPSSAQLKPEVVTVNVRPGVTMKYLEIKPPNPPSAAVILFAGGPGVLDLQPTGEIGTDLKLNS